MLGSQENTALMLEFGTQLLIDTYIIIRKVFNDDERIN